MDQETSILAALRREPEQTSLLFKVSALAAIALVAWDVIAAWVLPSVAVTAVLVLGFLAYGAALTYLVARIMSSSRQWVSRSAVTASRLSKQPGDTPVDLEALHRRRDELPDVEDDREDTTLQAQSDQPEPADATIFNESYFIMRVQEEVKNARRNGAEMCVAAVHVTVPNGDMTPDLAHQVAYEMARIAATQSRLMSQPLALNDSEFVFSLPHTGPDETRQFVRDIMRAFGDYWCYFGIAAFPRNAGDAAGLVERARAACETSLRSGKRGNVEYSAA